VSNKTLNALAREAYSWYPSGVINAADFMIKVGESDKDISTEQKRVHLAKLWDMLRYENMAVVAVVAVVAVRVCSKGSGC